MARPPMFQRATVTRIVKETDDARTFVLAPLEGPFSYRAGQYCTFRVRVDGQDLLRSYSMSSAPETDTELMTTIKRVPGGAVSNWLLDNVSEGDTLEVTRPAGVFCLRETDAPLLGFCGGSGITPILSLAKSALSSTRRSVRLLCADRDKPSMIFDAALAALVREHPDRLQVVRHRDDAGGFLAPAAVREFVGADGAADCYICGPEPFMDMVEAAWPGPGKVFIERFGTSAAAAQAAAEAAAAAPVTGSVTIILGRKRVTVPRHPNETLLESARRAGLAPPFSCEAGNCATCIAKLVEGSATMRVNDALADDEIADGYILTCQGVPDTENIIVDYE